MQSSKNLLIEREMEKNQSHSKRISETTSMSPAPREQSGAHFVSPVFLVAVILLDPSICKVSISKPSKTWKAQYLLAL